MSTQPIFDLSQYQYNLPAHRIANFPLPERDSSNLLVYRKGDISHTKFHQLPSHIKEGSLLVFNDTKVVPARILFPKNTGATIEVFLLEPASPSLHTNEALASRQPVVWHCAIGNLKRWKDGTFLHRSFEQDGETVNLMAYLDNREKSWVKLVWDNPIFSMGDILELAGLVPLPPYIEREAVLSDKERYQTVYAKHQGAVAAPTAGLHFTPRVLDALKNNGVSLEELTLHVGAGTFRPVKVTDIREHVMHAEHVNILKPTIQALLKHDKLIAVGTTSMRTLESLYWYGAKLIMEGPEATFTISQELPYLASETALPDKKTALKAILDSMEAKSLSHISGQTSIFIRPGYTFKMVDGLITNFHQPGSSLVMLVAAFIGADWQKIYQYALDNDFRFLSYGDSSLLWRA